ncbi:MAG TPA: hypothetical protein VM032_02300, partial [Vicinamibacterales bacterium]|nr:hypothetical protein [Vicinamibacterales bacterium]
MFKAMRYLPVLLAATVSIATPACAGAIYTQRYPVGDRDDRAFYNRGYRDGRESGAEDARRGRSYDLRRHNEYRDNRRGDDRGDLRAYREGFEAGYGESYRAYSRGGYGGDPRRGYPPQNYPRQQDPYYGNYPRQQDPYYGGGARGRFASPASQNGYRDGLEAGQRDARRGDRFDPVREKRYRDGDHDYNSRYGSRDEYKREYRAAFQDGY